MLIRLSIMLFIYLSAFFSVVSGSLYLTESELSASPHLKILKALYESSNP